MADPRAVLKRRTIVAASVLGLWTSGIEARLVYLQIFRQADLAVRADKQQLRTIEPPAKRGDIVDRRSRVLATSVDADTIIAVPSEISQPAAVVAKLCEALGDCSAKERQTLVERLGRGGAFSYVRRQISPDERRRVEAMNLDGIAFIKESKRFYPNRELAAHLLGWVGIDNKGLGGLEYAYDPQILAMANEPTFNPNAFREAQDAERRNRAVQDLYEPGSTFKVVTASAAIEEHVVPIDTLIDTNPGRVYIAGRPPITEDRGRNLGVLSFTDVIVKSSNVGVIQIGFNVGKERLSGFVSLFGFGRQVSPDFPGN